MFLRSFLRGRVDVAVLAMLLSILLPRGNRRSAGYFVTFFLPAIATALPLRVRAFV